LCLSLSFRFKLSFTSQSKHIICRDSIMSWYTNMTFTFFSFQNRFASGRLRRPLSLLNLSSHKVVIVLSAYFNITTVHFQYDSQYKHIDFHYQLYIFIFESSESNRFLNSVLRHTSTNQSTSRMRYIKEIRVVFTLRDQLNTLHVML